MDAFRPENFMLLPTMACQAGCRYCFAKKTGEVMTRETAEKALNFMACIAPERKDIHLTIHGAVAHDWEEKETQFSVTMTCRRCGEMNSWQTYW